MNSAVRNCVYESRIVHADKDTVVTIDLRNTRNNEIAENFIRKTFVIVKSIFIESSSCA